MNEQIGTATYSPEDNKLRLYPFARLPREIYDRVKAAGFSWAPKQELFVAGMWTPEREDLLCELCGEVGDEDKSLVERAEERAERFEDYSDKRERDAEQARKGVAAIADGIPFGQPILVGHHSERRARKDAERIENGMRKAVKLWETSKYWEQRAAGAVSHAKYKERPDVRARRIRTIEAEARKRERAKAEAENLMRFWRGELFAKNPATGEKRRIEITEENRDFIRELLGRMPACGVMVRGINGENWYSACDCLEPDGERYQNCPSKTVAELQASALQLQAGVIERQNRWLAHYANRLAYERAMLAADGGTATDRNAPEKGGAVKCWASHRGCWSYVVKVNRVSVTVLDNWGNGGANFTRNIPFDKLSAVLSKAQVDAHRAAGELIETHDKTGFSLSVKPDTKPEAPKPEAIQPAHEEKPQAADFDALKATLRAGVQVVAAPQLFPTPQELAERAIELADIQPGMRVLEPSAGTGCLLNPMFNADATGALFDPDNSRPVGLLVAVEINPSLAKRLRTTYACANVIEGDFLECNGDLGTFDRIVMNPPFENGSDIRHIMHALHMLRPGGRLVAICANGPRQQEKLQPLATFWEPLPAGTFAEQGTNVNTVLAVFEL
jgi:phospholipid N-methyltransferase